MLPYWDSIAHCLSRNSRILSNTEFQNTDYFGFHPIYVGCRKMKEEHHGYSDTNNILYVVYNHKRSSLGPLDHNVYIGPGFGVPYAKQMVSHSPRNLQRGHLLFPRVVQNRLSGLQCGSLRCSADRRVKRSIQQSLALDGYSAALHSHK